MAENPKYVVDNLLLVYVYGSCVDGNEYEDGIFYFQFISGHWIVIVCLNFALELS
jgi:hypothetical protein